MRTEKIKEKAKSQFAVAVVALFYFIFSIRREFQLLEKTKKKESWVIQAST